MYEYRIKVTQTLVGFITVVSDNDDEAEEQAIENDGRDIHWELGEPERTVEIVSVTNAIMDCEYDE